MLVMTMSVAADQGPEIIIMMIIIIIVIKNDENNSNIT